MSKFIEQAKEFFHKIETGAGYQACKPYMAEGATFECDVVPITDLAEYAEKQIPILTQTLAGCRYKLLSVTSNETQVVFCARFQATHTGEGGPVPPTNQSTNCSYSYIVEFNSSGKVVKLTKIWDKLTACLQYGWPLPDKPSFYVSEKYLP